MSVELHAAFADLLAVADRVSEDDLARPTPCTGWDVRRLLEHLVGWQRVFAACARDVVPPFDGESPTYRASADPVADLRASVADLLDATAARESDTIDLPYRGRVPVTGHVQELVAETVLHTWDLATAVGTGHRPGRAVLDVAHDGLTRLLGASFAPLAFGQSVSSDESGSLAELLAQSGRAG